MLANAASEAGAELCLGTTVAGCSAQAAGWELELQERRADGSNPTSRQLRAKVVVDATGRTASLATRLGGERLLLDHLVSIAAQLMGTDNPPEGYVMVETTPNGWWYSAPVPDGRLMAMLMTDSDLCGRDGLGSPLVWRSRLEAAAATHARSGSGRLSWGPRVVSAVSQRLRRRHSRPWLAVGDAALAVDPISGSGVVRALRSAHAAAETVLGILEGREEMIEPYERERDAECTAYLHERAMYYGFEQRWPASPFWQRRKAAWLQPAAVPSVAAR
jgi:flavin-dependent dehydrogenase